MKAVGIIAEYNPFHNGHYYQIQQAKEKSQADVVVAVMSGNFVQRGTPAIVDKWHRSQVALNHGVDLVIELPTVFCVQSADYFGQYAIDLLDTLNVQAISFGVEKGELKQFEQIVEAEWLSNHRTNCFNQSYHQNKLEEFKRILSAKNYELLLTPNNQLGLSYLRALKNNHLILEVYPVLREQAQHTDDSLNQQHLFASGTAIRRAVYHHMDISTFVSDDMATILKKDEHIAHLDKWFLWLKYKLVSEPVEQIRQYFQVEEGIEYRFKQFIQQANSLDEFVSLVQTKRFKKARIQRICLYMILNIKKDNIVSIQNKMHKKIRVLGATEKGIRFLKQQQNVPYVTQLKKEDIVCFQEQINFDNVYHLLVHQTEHQNFRRMILNNGR